MVGPTIHELLRWDQQLVWHAFTQMAEYEPFIIERPQGCKLYDLDGNEFLDGVSSLWCNLHGHRHPHLDRAVRDQLEKVAHVTSLGVSNPTTIELARKLTLVATTGLQHVFFSGDGSSAVEVAIKMAFQYWRQCERPCPQKTHFVAFDAAYHGDTLGSVSVGGVARFHDMFKPLLFEPIRLSLPDTYRTPSGIDPSEIAAYHLANLQQVLEARHQEIAAVVIEPLMQCAAGIIRHPVGFLKGVRELTRKYDVLLIADEVAVGFGRSGKMFACEHEEVSPDFLCLGKGLTAGYMAMAATLTTSEVFGPISGIGCGIKNVFSRTFLRRQSARRLRRRSHRWKFLKTKRR